MSFLTSDQLAMLEALTIAYGGEVIWRSSNMSRLKNCPGSVQLVGRVMQQGWVNRSGPAAREGTAAHAVIESALKGGPQPDEWVGRSIMLHDNPNDTHFVDEEMGDCAQEFLDIIDSLTAIPGTMLFSEQKLSMELLDPAEPLFRHHKGTGDVVLINKIERWIIILDFKYGKGIPVPGNAPQVKDYALLASLKYSDGEPWKWFGTGVFQPRLPLYKYSEDEQYKFFRFEPHEIQEDFLFELINAMIAALEPNPSFAPSIDNCRWCPAAPCPALRNAGLAMTRDSFDNAPIDFSTSSALAAFPRDIVVGTHETPRPAPAPGRITLPAPDHLDPGELSWILQAGEMFETWLSACKHRATQLSMAGTRVPLFALEQRRKHRQFVGTREEIEKKLLAPPFDLKPGKIYTEPKLKSPAQIEKMLSNLSKGALEELVTRPVGDLVLVRAKSDDQPVSPKTTLADFPMISP